MRKYFFMLLIAAIFQTGIYFYLDRIVLVPSANFSQRIISTESKFQIDPQKLSTDRKYYVELQTSCVNFFTADNILVKDVPLQAEDKVSYFSWVPDTHLALIGINSNTSQDTDVILKQVNLDAPNRQQELRISSLPGGSKIDDVAVSPQINVTYILVKNNNESLVYRSDADNHPTKVFTGSSVLGIAAIQRENTLLYDNSQDGSIYALSHNGKRTVVSPQEGQYALIGTDNDDNIYIGRLSSPGVISSVLKGTINGDFTEIQALNYPYPVASLSINYDGKVDANLANLTFGKLMEHPRANFLFAIPD